MPQVSTNARREREAGKEHRGRERRENTKREKRHLEGGARAISHEEARRNTDPQGDRRAFRTEELEGTTRKLIASACTRRPDARKSRGDHALNVQCARPWDNPTPPLQKGRPDGSEGQSHMSTQPGVYHHDKLCLQFAHPADSPPLGQAYEPSESIVRGRHYRLDAGQETPPLQHSGKGAPRAVAQI